VPQTRIPTVVRYFTKVDQSAGPAECWPWTGAKDPDGYGIFWDGTYRDNGRGRYVRVTRWLSARFHPGISYSIAATTRRVSTLPISSRALRPITTPIERRRGGAGRMHGSDHTGSKLSEAQVRAIRKRAADGSVSQAALAREYAVSTALVSKIINRKVWTHM
jgi:hypothetical protein